MLLVQDSQQTVTSVIFQDSSTLISSGAMDGTLKLWDVRKVSCGTLFAVLEFSILAHAA